MRRTKPQIFIAPLLLASALTAAAQIDLQLGTERRYRQYASSVDFMKPGFFHLDLRDGNFLVTGCTLNGSPASFPITPPANCNLGTTAYIVAGDVGGAVDDDGNVIPDGFVDGQTYWEVTTIQPAVGIAYGYPERCGIYSAPRSTLPRDLTGFADSTVKLYYDYRESFFQEYNVSGYQLDRQYQSRSSMDNELPIGLYIFNFPLLVAPTGAPALIRVQMFAIPEGFHRPYDIPTGFRFTRLNGAALKWSAQEFIEMDPRISNTIEWTGNDINVVFPSDSLYLSVTSLLAPFGDPTNDRQGPEGDIFPGSDKGGRVKMPTILTKSFLLPPGLLNVGRAIPFEGIMKIELGRSLNTTAISRDTSIRYFELPVKFVDTYEGWAMTVFPPGTPAADRLKTADPDKDGATNYQEWIAKTNPRNPTSKPARVGLSFVPTRSTERPSLGMSSSQGGTTTPTGFWEVRHPAPVTSPANEYEFEFSTDMVNWSVVSANDPNWQVIRETQAEVTDRDPDIILRSKSPTLSGKGFVRVRVSEVPETTITNTIPE